MRAEPATAWLHSLSQAPDGVYASFTLRADAWLEAVEALLHSPISRSDLEVSQSLICRRLE